MSARFLTGAFAAAIIPVSERQLPVSRTSTPSLCGTTPDDP